MEIKILHTQLIQLPEIHNFNGKETYAQKQMRILKSDNQHSKIYQTTSNTYPEKNKKMKNNSVLFKKTNFG